MSDTQKSQIEIFRGHDSIPLEAAGIMTIPEFTPVIAAGFAGMFRPDLERGDDTRVLFNAGGFSLVYVWFKKDYPLPLHSHDADCLYYIIAGSLNLGTEELRAGDGFFVPSDCAYSYVPGPDGVEVLEFRHAAHFDFNVLAKNEAFWSRAQKTAEANVEDWKAAKKPSLATAES